MTTKPQLQMPADTTTTARTILAFENLLGQYEWKIADAERRLDAAAKKMLKRAQSAVESTTRMLNNETCSLSWIHFAEGDLREAKEAEAEVLSLYREQRTIKFLLAQVKGVSDDTE